MGKLFQRAAAWLAGRFCSSAMIAMVAMVAMVADNLPLTDGWHDHPGTLRGNLQWRLQSTSPALAGTRADVVTSGWAI